MEEELKKECKKTKFTNEQFALQYIDRLQKTSTRSTVPMRAYMCTFCGSWHLTSQKDRKDEVIQQLKEHIDSLKVEKKEIEAKYKTLTKALNGVINVANKDIPAGGKTRKSVLEGVNIMRELLKETIKTLK